MTPAERIAELEAALTRKDARIAEQDARIAEQDARIAEQDARIAELEKQLGALTQKLGRNSCNSHLPPSSDPPGTRKGKDGRRKGKKRKAERKRGGQPGHQGSHRVLLPPERVDQLVDLYPARCECCAQQLPKLADPSASRHQHIELPPLKPHTTEWRRHEVECPRCQHKTRAAYDDDLIPSSPFGPRLMAIMAMLTGIYHLSRRKTQGLLDDLLDVRVSLGALSAVESRVSEAVKPAVEEAWAEVGQAAVKHTDGTTWLQSGGTLSLWTIASAAATVFKIVADASKKTLEPLFGLLQGILVSDRAKALNFWTMDRRQICWSHLIRKFVSFSERDGPAGRVGRELLDYTAILFEWWHDFKDGKLSRQQFISWMAPVREQVETVLARAAMANLEGVSGSCADILEHQLALWTFVEQQGVEPTNNHAEREIRAFVLWRKRSFGTQSARGNVFAEQMMTVCHTARKQKRNVLSFLVACCEARLGETPTPSLFDTQAREAA